MSGYRGDSRGRGGPPPRGGLPSRPGGPPQNKGDVYRTGPLDVVVNCFRVTQLPTRTYYHYDVLLPETLKNRARSIEIIDRLQTHVAPHIFQPKAIHDGRANLFSSHRLALSDGNSGSYTVGKYNIKLTLSAAQTIDCSELDAMLKGQVAASSGTDTATMLLQLLIRAAPNLMQAGDGAEVHNVRGPRAYYTHVGRRQIGGGLELWQGLFQSARASVGQLLINIDISMSAMIRSGNLLEVAMDVLGIRDQRGLQLPGDHRDFKKLKNFLKNVFVRVKPSGRKRQIRDLQAFAGEYKFNKDNGPTTVQRHFQEVYNISLKQPKAFGIITGSKERKVVYPAELCTIEAGQFYRKKVPTELTKSVVDFATKNPQERLHIINSGVGLGQQGGLAAPALEYQTSPFIQDAGMTVSAAPLVIRGNVIAPPQLAFSPNVDTENPQHGKWNFVRKKFLTPVTLKKWAVIDYVHNQPMTQNLVQQLLQCFTALGMIADAPFVSQSTGYNVKGDIMSLPGKPTFILFILRREAEETRQQIKYTCDVLLGILNQCVRETKLSNPSNQYLNNVALKINARLGGENSIPRSGTMKELKKSKFMLVGADVGHPGAGVRNQPSVTSLVWSWDLNGIKYKALTNVQPPRTEIIQDLRGMMEIAIKDNAERLKGPPDRIIFYRDGVSESEFQQVQAEEITAVQAAIDSCYRGWEKMGLVNNIPKPKLTFVVVGKRHHIRFFPQNGVGADSTGNCPAGFMADQGVKSPTTRDFYLQAHGGLKGTSRPGHYTVLHDENFSAIPAVLQELSFIFCHCYASATRSVSLPAPVYYADKVCLRAKFHYERFQGSESVISDDETFNLALWKDRFKSLHGSLIHSMYFL